MAWRTASEIDARRAAVAGIASVRAPATLPTEAQLAALPEPVQRWYRYTFRGTPPAVAYVDVEMRGQFRRPRSTAFAATTARQRIAAAPPALVFDATTPLAPGVWARAYDAYVDGRMTMKAKVLSAFAVVDEASTPALELASLRRWLIESATCPTALLPGGAVRWEPVDAARARARASLGGLEATLIATFADSGRLLRFDAEEDGDLALPYHGAGERVERSDDRLVEGMMIPHVFVFSRVAGGRAESFWHGEITAIHYVPAVPPVPGAPAAPTLPAVPEPAAQKAGGAPVRR